MSQTLAKVKRLALRLPAISCQLVDPVVRGWFGTMKYEEMTTCFQLCCHRATATRHVALCGLKPMESPKNHCSEKHRKSQIGPVSRKHDSHYNWNHPADVLHVLLAFPLGVLTGRLCGLLQTEPWIELIETAKHQLECNVWKICCSQQQKKTYL